MILLTGWQRADPVASPVIAALIVPRTPNLLRETLSLLLESPPPGLDLDDVRAHLIVLPHLLDEQQACVAEHFPVSVEHCTVQPEMAGHGEHEVAARS